MAKKSLSWGFVFSQILKVPFGAFFTSDFILLYLKYLTLTYKLSYISILEVDLNEFPPIVAGGEIGDEWWGLVRGSREKEKIFLWFFLFWELIREARASLISKQKASQEETLAG